MDFLRNLFSHTLGLGSAEKVLDDLTLEGVARYMQSGKCESPQGAARVSGAPGECVLRASKSYRRVLGFCWALSDQGP